MIHTLILKQGEIKLNRNVKESIKYLKRCIPGEPPHAESMYQLHLIYEFGLISDGINSDLEYSKSVLNESALLGYPAAMCKLGKCKSRGLLGYDIDNVNNNHYLIINSLKLKNGFSKL